MHTGRALFNSLSFYARSLFSIAGTSHSATPVSSAQQLRAPAKKKNSLERGWFLCSSHLLHPSYLLLLPSSASIASARFHRITRLPLVLSVVYISVVALFHFCRARSSIKALAINSSFFCLSVAESIDGFL